MRISVKTKRYIESAQYLKIKKDMLEQLERNGTNGEFYVDLVYDYMNLWVTKSLLADDIITRGVIVAYDNGGGQKGKKKNESVEQILKVNGQMLKILSEIGIKPSHQDGDLNDVGDM